MVEVDESRILEQRQGRAWRGGRGGWRRGRESGEEVLAWADGKDPATDLATSSTPHLCALYPFSSLKCGVGVPPQCDSET